MEQSKEIQMLVREVIKGAIEGDPFAKAIIDEIKGQSKRLHNKKALDARNI